MKRLMVVLCAAMLVVAGCAAPTAVLRTTQFEQAQLVADATLVNRLFDERAEANFALIAAQNVALEQSITGKPGADPAWILETIKGAEAIKAMLRDRISSDEKARAVVLANLAARSDVLKKAETLIVRTQQWNSETQALITDLLSKTLVKTGGAP